MAGETGKNQPLVVVITVSLNHAVGLEETINSVLAQTYPYIEYIVIDGGSTDNSLEIINKYSKKITKWISEPDGGIYDAMNKGVAMGTGEWVIFMNAGDCFVNNEVVQDIFTPSRKEVDLIYGNHKVLYEDGFERLQRAGNVCDLWKGMIFSHQAVFCRIDLVRRHSFSLTDPIGADFEMLFDAYKSGARFFKSNVVVAKIRNQGLSDKHRIRSLISHWRVVRRYKEDFQIIFFYTFFIIDMFVRQLIKKILPVSWTSGIIKLKYRFIRKGA
jgi:glycosyltransferase involved in cell wall biosynthesis